MDYSDFLLLRMLTALFDLICRILNKLTPEKFDLLKGQLIDSGITTADILKVLFFFLAHDYRLRNFLNNNLF